MSGLSDKATVKVISSGNSVRRKKKTGKSRQIRKEIPGETEPVGDGPDFSGLFGGLAADAAPEMPALEAPAVELPSEAGQEALAGAQEDAAAKATEAAEAAQEAGKEAAIEKLNSQSSETLSDKDIAPVTI